MTAFTNSTARAEFERDTREIKKGMNSLEAAMMLLQKVSAAEAGFHEIALRDLADARSLLADARRSIGFGREGLEGWYRRQTIEAEPGGGGETAPPAD